MSTMMIKMSGPRVRSYQQQSSIEDDLGQMTLSSVKSRPSGGENMSPKPQHNSQFFAPPLTHQANANKQISSSSSTSSTSSSSSSSSSPPMTYFTTTSVQQQPANYHYYHPQGAKATIGGGSSGSSSGDDLAADEFISHLQGSLGAKGLVGLKNLGNTVSGDSSMALTLAKIAIQLCSAPPSAS